MSDKIDYFNSIVSKEIKRNGIDNLMKWLESTDFFAAPASTVYHGNHEGGLVEHSINVFEFLSRSSVVKKRYSMETIAIVSLFHDVCKVYSYSVSTKNVKNDATNQWEKVPFYKSNVLFPYGHGEKSVYIIQKFINLTDEEALAINWHMGGFDSRVKGGSYDLSSAFEMSPLTLELHIADMRATYLSESKKEPGIGISFSK